VCDRTLIGAQFEKGFYVEVPDIKNMTDDEVAEYRRNELDGIVIRGGKKKGVKPCPRPIKKFSQVRVHVCM
jgi:hypothetical protein